MDNRSKCPGFASEGDIIFDILATTNLPFAGRETAISIIQNCSLYRVLHGKRTKRIHLIRFILNNCLLQLCDCQVQNLQGRTAGWRPREGLMWPLGSEGSLEEDFSPPPGTSVFSHNSFNWLDEAHLHDGEQSVYSKSTVLLIVFKNPHSDICTSIWQKNLSTADSLN